MRVFDAHTHIGPEKGWRILLGGGSYSAAATASAPADCDRLLALSSEFPALRCVFGVHPWHSDSFDPLEIRPILKKGAAVGEIGMDSVWCGIKLSVQRRAFISQLEMAEELKLPVVLHTKGCEREIADIIAGLTVPVLVHWFSGENCPELLDRYIEMDCFFTVGPDIHKNRAVREAAERLPLARIMAESDGMSALRWAGRRVPSPAGIPDALCDIIRTVAGLRGMDFEETAGLMYENAMTFFPAKI